MARPLIMVVDDNRITTKLMLRYLQIHGFDGIDAADGVECMEKLNTVVPQAIILDVMMPRMDGFETTQAIKANPKTAKIPVAIVTALNDMATQVRAVECGADDFLTKPLDEKLLITKVRMLATLSKATREADILREVAEAYKRGDVARAQELLSDEVFALDIPQSVFAS
jgi:CheY-like chemotaxis protein